jgi:hypothetical protein
MWWCAASFVGYVDICGQVALLCGGVMLVGSLSIKQLCRSRLDCLQRSRLQLACLCNICCATSAAACVSPAAFVTPAAACVTPAAAPAGFCTGYVGAIKGSVRLVSGVSCKAATAAACLAVRLLSGAFRLLMRAL